MRKRERQRQRQNLPFAVSLLQWLTSEMDWSQESVTPLKSATGTKALEPAASPDAWTAEGAGLGLKLKHCSTEYRYPKWHCHQFRHFMGGIWASVDFVIHRECWSQPPIPTDTEEWELSWPEKSGELNCEYVCVCMHAWVKERERERIFFLGMLRVVKSENQSIWFTLKDNFACNNLNRCKNINGIQPPNNSFWSA